MLLIRYEFLLNIEMYICSSSEEQNNLIMQDESLWQSLSLIIYVAIFGLLIILPRDINVLFCCIEEIAQ